MASSLEISRKADAEQLFIEQSFALMQVAVTHVESAEKPMTAEKPPQGETFQEAIRRGGAKI